MVIQWTQLAFFYKNVCPYNSSLHVSNAESLSSEEKKCKRTQWMIIF